MPSTSASPLRGPSYQSSSMWTCSNPLCAWWPPAAGVVMGDTLLMAGGLASGAVGCLPLVMAGSGAVLVAAAPGGPAQPVRQAVFCWGEQAGDLVAGQQNQVWRVWAAGAFEGGGDGEARGGEHGQGDPPVPGGPAADLMFIQAGQALAGLEVLLDRPAEPGDVDHGGQGDRPWAVAAVEGQFPGAPVAADQQPAAARAGVADGDPGPVIPAVSLGALACRYPLPGPFGQAGGEFIGAGGAPGPGGYPVVARDRQHVGDPLLFQPGAQRPVVSVDLVAGDPGERHFRGDGPLNHPPCELRLGRERHVRGDSSRRAAGRVTGPGLRQVQLAVDQRMPAPRHIPQVDSDLGVLDPPGGAGVLPLHTGVAVPFLTSPVSSATSTASR